MSGKFKAAMVIDDNNIDLYIASRVIAKSHFADTILTYTSAVEALQYLMENENLPEALPEVIFVDIYMPVMSGFEFMQAFDNLPAAIKTRCRAYIVSSTIDENDIVRTQRDKNVVAFKEKPLDIEFLQRIS